RLCGSGLIVDENEALESMAIAFLRLKLVAEPGGAVALAAAIFRKGEIEGNDVVVVISGGNVDPDLFAKSLNTLV
ncbi:MAG TPA: threonine ammonia-lyase, partial [Rhodobacteraceae bacterium]|nr:threonine ammonia-lyase [Paracoccaceae bacterium]